MKIKPDDDELLELLRTGQIQEADLDEPSAEQDADVLRDDLDELIENADVLRQLLGLRPK